MFGMGLIKKSLKGAVAVSTLGGSVAAEKALSKAGVGEVPLTDEEASAGAVLAVMSHEKGRNARVVVYPNRVERTKARSRTSFSSANQEVETTPMKAVSSIQVVKDGRMSVVRLHATGNPIDLRVRHQDAEKVRQRIVPLIL
jgi:hypothetical protein